MSLHALFSGEVFGFSPESRIRSQEAYDALPMSQRAHYCHDSKAYVINCPISGRLLATGDTAEEAVRNLR